MAATPSINNTFGIMQQNNITMDSLVQISNITNDPIEFFANVNNTVYQGNLYFALLCTAKTMLNRYLESILPCKCRHGWARRSHAACPLFTICCAAPSSR